MTIDNLIDHLADVAAFGICRHRGFETVTYVLPDRAGLVHRDSIGTKMSYGDGAVQWMTAGRGMLHEETTPNPNPDPDSEPNPHPNPHPNPNPDLNPNSNSNPHPSPDPDPDPNQACCTRKCGT